MGDDVWHRVAVAKKGKEVRLYLDGKEVAAGNIDNSVTGKDVGLDLFAARFRTPPGGHDWFWNGSIKNVNIYDAALDGNIIFLIVPLNITASEVDPFFVTSLVGA